MQSELKHETLEYCSDPIVDPFVGCDKLSQKAEQQMQLMKLFSADFKPFFIYKDKGTSVNHFIPSGFYAKWEMS